MSELGTTSRALLSGALDRVYAPNQVPDKPTYPYLEVAAGEYLPSAYSLDASHGVGDYQLVVRVFGRTEDSVSAWMATTQDLLVDAWLTAPSGQYGPGRQELRPLPPTRDPDDNGVLSSIATLTFAKEK